MANSLGSTLRTVREDSQIDFFRETSFGRLRGGAFDL